MLEMAFALYSGAFDFIWGEYTSFVILTTFLCKAHPEYLGSFMSLRLTDDIYR